MFHCDINSISASEVIFSISFIKLLFIRIALKYLRHLRKNYLICLFLTDICFVLLTVSNTVRNSVGNHFSNKF